MIIQNLIMSIFCTIDKTMVFENLQKIQKTRKRFFFAIFYENSSYKTYLTEELIYTYYYTKLSYIAFIFYLFLTSHVNSHALWLQWTVWYSNWRRIHNRKKKKKSRELSYQNDNFLSTRITSEEKKKKTIENKTKENKAGEEKFKEYRKKEKEKENRNINEKSNI